MSRDLSLKTLFDQNPHDNPKSVELKRMINKAITSVKTAIAGVKDGSMPEEDLEIELMICLRQVYTLGQSSPRIEEQEDMIVEDVFGED